jgi:cystathionine beta-lyase
MRHQQHSALKVASWLESLPDVAQVLYPALPSDPGHAIWKRDFSGAASLFGVILKPQSAHAVAALIDALELFGIGSSWGGFESLAIRADVRNIRTAKPWHAVGPLLRLHIGLEDPEDLIGDLDQAFGVMRGTSTSAG